MGNDALDERDYFQIANRKAAGRYRPYLKQYFYWLVLESQLPHKNRQLDISISDSTQQVDDFVGDLTFQNHLINTFYEIR